MDDTIGETVAIIDTGSVNDSNGTWTNHPAFWWDNDSDGIRETGEELPGMWVAKFEPKALEGLDNTEAGDSVTTKTVRVIPGVQPWRFTTIGNSFNVLRGTETNSIYVWGIDSKDIDTHMMKNTEWGAVVYLSKSSLGKENEVVRNRIDPFATGGGVDSSYVSNLDQSTTGTIYGIYDMAAGAFDMVAAYVDNGDGDLTCYGSDLINADAKYKDAYTVTNDTIDGNYANAINKKGDALYETSGTHTDSTSWFSDCSYMPYGYRPWFIRGGIYSYSCAGIFEFNNYAGYARTSYTFRPSC
jgi:hypothetical protein